MEYRTTTFRGLLHLNLALILPYVAFIVQHALAERPRERVLNLFLMAEVQAAVSAALHTSYDTNPVWQKLDHVVVFMSFWTNLYVLDYIAPVAELIPALAITVLAAVQKALHRHSHWTRWDSMFVTAIFALFIRAAMWTPYPTEFARQLIYINIMSILAVFCVFTLQPKRDNAIFGYHEIMHVLTMAILMCYVVLIVHH